MIIQTKNNISQHCGPPSSASLSAAEVALTTTSTTTTTTNGPRQQQQPQSQLPPTGPPHYVDLHVNAGECVSLQLLDGQEQVVAGPTTITMISQQPNPPVPIPVQVPPGHMIHQIADENGTLKHIILSIMDGNEEAGQLDSAVITLPQGTFRIDSNGELVSTSNGERSTSGEGGRGGTVLTTLPQQAYFANYDGSPPNTYDETTPNDNIEPTTGKPQLAIADAATPIDCSNYRVSDTASGEVLASDEKVTSSEAVVEQGSTTSLDEQSEQSTATISNKTSGNNNNSTLIKSDHKLPPASSSSSSSPAKQTKVVSNQQATETNATFEEGAEVQKQQTNRTNVTNLGQNNSDETVNVDSSKEEVALNTAEQQQHSQAEQAIAAAPPPPPLGSVNDVAPYPAPHQVMSSEMDLMSSGLAPILSTVDGQMYGYPPCCCCCYCDPAQEAVSGDQSLAVGGLPGQQDVGLMVLPAAGQQQVAGNSDQLGASVNRTNCRALTMANNLNHTTNSPIIAAYPSPMLGGARPPSMQTNLQGMPIGLATGAPLSQPIAGCQNGIVPVPGGAHMAADCNTAKLQQQQHPAAGGGKGGRNGGYNKQLKMVPVSSSQSAGAERGQQSAYGGYAMSGHKAYNSIVSGHHHSHHSSNNHQQHQHHHHHQQQQHQQQHYHQPNTDGSGGSSGAPLSQSTNITAFNKNQAPMSNHQSSVGGSYSSPTSSSVYSNYNHVPTATLTNVVSSNNKATLQSSQMGNGGALVYGSSSNHKLQQQLVQPTSNGPVNYQQQQQQQQQQQHSSGRTGPNSDSNYMQRASRDHANTYGHTNTNNNNNSASGYVQTNLRQMSQQQQHNNENKPRQSQLGDKNSNQQQQQHNNRYLNVKGISNNHIMNNSTAPSCNSLSHQSGSVSPIRARMKASSQQQQQQQHHHHNNNHNHHHHHHHTNQPDLGVRASHHYNQLNSINEIKDTNLLNNSHPASYHNRDQSFSLNQSKSTKKNNSYPHDGLMMNNTPSKHINNAGYYTPPNHLSSAPNKQAGGAWQPSNSGGGHKMSQSNKASNINANSSLDLSRTEAANQTTGDQAGEKQLASVVSRQVTANNRTSLDIDSVNCDVIDDGDQSIANEIVFTNSSAQKENINIETDSRNSRIKQEKCHNTLIKSQVAEDRYKRSPSKASAKLSSLAPNENSSQTNEVETNKTLQATSESNLATKTADTNKSRVAKEANNIATNKQLPLKQQDGQTKRANKEKATGQKASKQRVESPKPATESTGSDEDNSEQVEVSIRKQKQSQTPVVKVAASSSGPERSSESLNEAPDLTPGSPNLLRQKHSKTKDHGGDNESAANNTKKAHPHHHHHHHHQGTDNTETLANNDDRRLEVSSDHLEKSESHSNDDIDNDVSSIVSRPESPGSLKSPQLSRLIMRTSLSENNIQSLDSHNYHHQQAKQKLQADQVGLKGALNKKKNDITSLASSVSSTATATTTATTKRRANNSSKSEQKVKLSTIPQLKILNLNCTSITSSSVQLRWSYNPSLADDYGIHQHGSHHHHHTKSALMDHFVIESSNSKNIDTNTLVSPKIVYQGCALTCRISHLSSEKIYHFKVRRTALVTITSSGSQESTSSGEHSVVSEILSVTLPSVQQQQSNSTSGQQQLTINGNSKKSLAGRQQRVGSLDGSSSDHHHHNQSSSNAGQTTTNEESLNHNHNHNNNNHHHHRGNASSHNSNSNHTNNCGNNHNKQSIKFTNLFRQYRGKLVANVGRLIRNSLSSYSDTKFAGLLLVVFTIFAMLLAVFIHLYIVAPVTE